MVPGGTLDREGLEDDVLRHKEDGTAGVYKWIVKAWRKHVRKTRWKRKIRRNGEIKLSATVGFKFLKKLEVSSLKVSCG